MDQDALCYRAQVPWELRPPSRPSCPRRDIWTGRTGARPLPLRQGPEGLPCGLHMGGSAPSTASYTLFPLAGNSRPPLHLRFFSPPLGFHRGVSRGEGKYGRTALVSGAGCPTTPGSPHPLIRIHTLAHPGADMPSASAAGGRQGGGRRDTKAEPGAKVNLAAHRGLGQKGLLGLFNADGFPGNDPGWPGWTLHSRKLTFAKVGTCTFSGGGVREASSP
jgi:hypothetical protein